MTIFIASKLIKGISAKLMREFPLKLKQKVWSAIRFMR